MISVLEALLLLAPHIATLVESLTSKTATYDPEVEKQALLDMERAIADARMKKALG